MVSADAGDGGNEDVDDEEEEDEDEQVDEEVDETSAALSFSSIFLRISLPRLICLRLSFPIGIC